MGGVWGTLKECKLPVKIARERRGMSDIMQKGRYFGRSGRPCNVPRSKPKQKKSLFKGSSAGTARLEQSVAERCST